MLLSTCINLQSCNGDIEDYTEFKRMDGCKITIKITQYMINYYGEPNYSKAKEI
jgi:hypothetical protein